MLIFAQCDHEWTCTKALAREENGDEKLMGFVWLHTIYIAMCLFSPN